MNGGGSLYQNVLTMSDFCLYDDETLELMKECQDITGIEPVNKMLTGIDEHTHIPELLSVIKALDK